MKAGKAWCFAVLLVATGLSSTSCGKDEVSGGNGGTGATPPEGGADGGGGTPPLGRSGSGGSGGTVPGVSGSRLGRGCIEDADCEDSTAPGLTCVSATESLGNGAPPKGLCTAECTSDADCADFGAGSLCYPFAPQGNSGYCVEGCSFGTPGIGEFKCHNREEFACNPALLGDTGEPCDETADCQSGELCIDGTCAVVFPACLPSCRGDIDCEAGMYCDQSFLSGVCVDEEPTGKALGEPCTLPGPNEPSEPDECLGFCQADSADSTTGRCAATCGLLSACAWNSATSKFDGACFYASILTFQNGAAGDFGFCTSTCNCTDECNDSELACSLLPQGSLPNDFKGPGLCFSADDETDEYNQCDAPVGGAGGTGAGGAGGEPGGEAGSPSAGGQGGAGG